MFCVAEAGLITVAIHESCTATDAGSLAATAIDSSAAAEATTAVDEGHCYYHRAASNS